MRISNDENDPGYAFLRKMMASGCIRIDVTLDGAAINGVVTADDEHGVIQSIFDPNGKEWIISKDGTRQLFEYRGKVDIRCAFYNERAPC